MNTKTFLISLLTLTVAATIYPPFDWGSERLATERERHRTLARGIDGKYVSADDLLPIKAYAFLLGPTQKEFQVGLSWESSSQRYVPVNLQLERDLPPIVVPMLELDFAFQALAT